MNDQIGWRGLAERLKNEAPRYVQLLPELPRLVHQALARPRTSDTRVLEALLEEQRRSNRWLLALTASLIGFVAGALLVLVLLRWHG
jgi:ubiquinone biosynthesis protein